MEELPNTSESVEIELLIMEYKELRSDLTEVQRITDRWGTIMLPLSAGILAVAVNSLISLPAIGVTFLVFLSIVTVAIWRLIGYNAVHNFNRLRLDLHSVELEISKRHPIERSINWEKHIIRYRNISQRALLDLFALIYISTGIAIIIVKFYLY